MYLHFLHRHHPMSCHKFTLIFPHCPALPLSTNPSSSQSGVYTLLYLIISSFWSPLACSSDWSPLQTYRTEPPLCRLRSIVFTRCRLLTLFLEHYQCCQNAHYILQLLYLGILNLSRKPRDRSSPAYFSLVGWQCRCMNRSLKWAHACVSCTLAFVVSNHTVYPHFACQFLSHKGYCFLWCTVGCTQRICSQRILKWCFFSAEV